MEFVPAIDGTSAGELSSCYHCGQSSVAYCVECKYYLCAQSLETHKTGQTTARHELRALNTADIIQLSSSSLSQLNHQVKQALDQSRSSKDEVMKAITQVEKRIQEIQHQEQETTSKIQKTFSDIRYKLNERESALLTQLKSLTTQHLTTLETQLESLKKITTAVDHQCQVATT